MLATEVQHSTPTALPGAENGIVARCASWNIAFPIALQIAPSMCFERLLNGTLFLPIDSALPINS